MHVTARQRNQIRWTAVVLWAAAIFAASAVPGSNIPGDFGSVAHFVEYAILATLLFYALAASKTPELAWALAIALASTYGITDELHQLFVPLRVADPADWLVDTIGAATGATLCYALTRLSKRGADS